MWTPKRVLLLVSGIAVFSLAYLVYAHFLGVIDGLPPLPGDCVPLAQRDQDLPAMALPPGNEAERKLRQAFGEECIELQRTIKLEVRAHGVVLAADHFNIEPDGRVKLAPFSIAIFGKPKGEASYPEINTVRSDVAYLTFEKPITSLADMGKYKIVGGELVRDLERRPEGGFKQRVQDKEGGGTVTIVNNRRSPQRDDDLSLTTPGPVFYDERIRKIWTDQPVKLIDLQSKPKPTEVTATGLDVNLADENAPPGAAPAGTIPKVGRPHPPAGTVPPRKQRGPTVSGVERVVLRGDVDMHLWEDARSGFLGGTRVESPAAKVEGGPPAGPQKALVVINTQGPFTYDVTTDKARFDISRHPGPHPNNVVVQRIQEQGGTRDQLISDHLELQFCRKSVQPRPATATAGPAGSGGDDRSVQLEIETAHAWGDQVTLSSDSEGLTAFGKDLVYEARTRQSTLRGDPEMIAMKDGNEIYARELVLVGLGQKEGQQAMARGPGRIKIRDRSSGRPTVQATWKDTLVSSREGTQDVLTLTGDAAFEDEEHGQHLRADRLKVWLDAGEARTPVAGSAPRGETPKRRPRLLEGVGHVLARSPELHVHDTDRLIVRFKDPTPADNRLPATMPQPGPAADAGQRTSQLPGPNGRAGSTPAPGLTPPTRGGAEKLDSTAGKPKKPIDLSAGVVEATVVTIGSKNELERIWCEGTVRVLQEPSSPQEKGVDIRGQTLRLARFAEGNVLKVTGQVAEVYLDKLAILGPEVNIDQKENKAWVTGGGAMRLPSDTGFQGEKLGRSVEMTIHWNENMFFNGTLKHALFFGGVQAEQENARLLCQTMQVFLDRVVSLKEGERGTAPAKVEKVVCDKSVRVEDTLREKGQLVRYQRIESHELSFDNEDGLVNAPGPGVVRILQLGAKGDGLPTSATTTPAPRGEEEFKLTRVTYFGRMFANNVKRTVIFHDNVQVVHLPSENPDVVIDIDRLPPGALYLRSDQLKVYSRRHEDGKTRQEMEAHGKAVVRSQEFWGNADVIKYDETKDLVVFEGSEGSLATLYRVRGRGVQPEEIKGVKILYSRRSNDFKIEGARKIDAH